MTASLIYLFCIAAFILAIRLMSSPQTAVSGSHVGICGMIAAVVFAFARQPEFSPPLLAALVAGGIAGIIGGLKIKITSLPQMIAAFNGLGGGAAVCIAAGEISTIGTVPPTLPPGAVVGAVTFSGSLIAFCKLQGILSGRSRSIPWASVYNVFFAVAAAASAFYLYFHPFMTVFYLLAGLSL